MENLTVKDFSPTGIKYEGQFENDRNADSRDLFKAIIKEVFGVTDVIIAHHLVYVREETRADGFKYQIVEEIPSADALVFSHAVAKTLWPNTWQANLTKLALEPIETRDQLLATLYAARKQ